MTSAPHGEDSDRLLIVLSDDLLFPSRIRESLRALPYRLRIVAADSALPAALADELPSGFIVNLTARRYDPAAVIESLKAQPRTAALPILAFAGHVESEKHEAARRAGADLVAANSSVSLHLPALLNRLFAPDTPANSQNDEREDAADAD